MSSDIDIEEHDVMDHPFIKKIFPDLSCIKTELIDLDDEEPTVFENIKIVAISESRCNEEVVEIFEPVQGNEELIISDDEQCFEDTNELEPVNVEPELIVVDDEQCEDVIGTNDVLSHEILDSESSVNNNVEQSSLLIKNTIVLGSNTPNKMIVGSNVPKKAIDSNNAEKSCSNVTVTSFDSEARFERDPFSAKVILKDWGYILKKHPFYCYECLTLFPSQSALNIHAASEHSLLVPIEEVEVTKLDSVSQQTEDLGKIMQKCPICGCVFKTQRNYLAHIESKHDTINLQPINEEFTGNCMLCTGKQYKTLHAYYKHIAFFHSKVYHRKYSDIEPRKRTARKSTARADIGNNTARKSTTKQGEGTKNVARKSTSRQTKNIALKRTSMPQPRRIAVKSTSRCEEAQIASNCSRQSNENIETPKLNYIICPICGVHYQHVWQYVAHCNTNHQAIYLSPERLGFTGLCECGFKTTAIKKLNNHISKVHEELFKKIATDLQEYYCLECNVTFATLNSYNIHKIKHNCESDREEIKCERSRKTEDFSLLKETETKSEPKNVTDEAKVVIIPKETIFKCSRCDLYSVSSRTLFFHNLKCTGAKSKVVCDVCDRSLRYQDVESHKLQHQLMPTINDVEISRETFYKLVLVCTTCKVGFDGFSINTNHAIECEKKEGTLCQKCNLKIAPECLVRHEKLHSGSTDPLAVEFLCGNVNELKELTEMESNSLYYCSVCKSYDPAKHADYHVKGVCLRNKIFRICRFCGLRFSHDNFANHILRHQNNSFDLNDISFVDIHTGEVIKPKIPDWNKLVGDPKVKYSGEKRKRESFNGETVYCGNCQESYDELAYKIHLQYHEQESTNYIDSEIMQKYLIMQSICNIVFLCRSCNITFDNYDLAVEHSQDHIMKNLKTPNDKCTKCDLIFEAQSLERHKNLHKGAEIDKDSLCMLSFNFKDLLSKSWYNLFKAISDEQKSHILSKSLYDRYRNLRLELNHDGPSTHTLYKCAVCDAIVDRAHLLDHAQNRDLCTDQDKFSCSSCELAFITRDSLEQHESNHSPANQARIILFNKPEHFSLNVRLIRKSTISKSAKAKKSKSKSLSRAIFYECLSCGAGIQSLLNIKRHSCLYRKTYVKCGLCELSYRRTALKSHMLFHDTLDKFYVAPFRDGDLVLQGKTKSIIIYKCKKCNICTLKKLPAHTCVFDNSCSVCSSCDLKFSLKSYRIHMVLHKNHPNLTRNNLVVIQYTPGLPEFNNEPTSQKLLTEKSMSDQTIIVKPMSGKLSNVEHEKPKRDHPMSRFLYKCACGILFVKWNQLRVHVVRCNDDSKSAHCKCGLKFHRLSLQDHLNVHSNCTSIKNYLVACVNVGKAAIEKARKKWLWYCTVCKTYYNDIKNLNCHFKGNKRGPSELCTICRIRISSNSFEDHMELHKEDNEFNHKQLHKLFLRMIGTDALKMPRQPVKRVRPTLYKCAKCDVYFTREKQLKSHLDEARHDIEDRIECNICNYFFPTNSLLTHKQSHHYRKKYKRQDFAIETSCSTEKVDEADEEVDIEGVSDNERPDNRGHPTEPRHHDFANMPENIKRAVNKSISKKPIEDLRKLYKCGKCHLCFMLKKTVISHLQGHSNTKRRSHRSHSCSICGLEFNTRSLMRHIFVHHKTLNLQVQDFEILVYTSPETFTTIRIKSKKQTTKRKKKCGRVEHAKKMKFVPKALEPSKQPTPSPPKPQAVAESQPTASNVAYFENASQIFKCAECNVCFTNYVMCYDHTLNHKPLDNTEYIGCKLCDFQLLCECLGVHMKGHREGTFNIDELVVKEFQPKEGVPSIKTYLARDSLEANAISTTTTCS